MGEMVKIALDAMGGDYAPLETVKGAVEALAATDDIYLYIVGKEDAINDELQKYEYDKKRVEIVPADEVIETAEPPVMAIRQKKNSSMVKALYLVKDGTCDAFVSAGSSGAILVGGQLIVGRLPGVERAPLGAMVPSETGRFLLFDCGANVDARSQQLEQFAKMGSIYVENVLGIKNPRVGIVNIGAEEEKGNLLVKETFPILKECKDINFIGSVEARDILSGMADVVVCDAFSGNIILKTVEGVADVLVRKIKEGMMTTTRSKVGALLVKPALKNTLKMFSVEEYGGAPLLGLKGLVVKTHGNSKAIEIKNSLLQCKTFKEQRINEQIKEKLSTGSV